MSERRWQSQKLWKPLSAYDAMAAVADIGESGEGFAAYARRKGFHRSAVSDALRERAPELHARIVEANGGEEANENRRRGQSFESSARAALARRGYLVVRSYASKGPFDMLAVGRERPNLFVQAKKAGVIGSAEWNRLFEVAEQYDGWPVLVRRPAGQDRGFEWLRLRGPRQKRERAAGLLVAFDPARPYQDSLLAPVMAATG